MTQDKLEKFYETQAAWLHYRKQQGDSPTPPTLPPFFLLRYLMHRTLFDNNVLLQLF